VRTAKLTIAKLVPYRRPKFVGEEMLATQAIPRDMPTPEKIPKNTTKVFIPTDEVPSGSHKQKEVSPLKNVEAIIVLNEPKYRATTPPPNRPTVELTFMYTSKRFES